MRNRFAILLGLAIAGCGETASKSEPAAQSSLPAASAEKPEAAKTPSSAAPTTSASATASSASSAAAAPSPTDYKPAKPLVGSDVPLKGAAGDTTGYLSLPKGDEKDKKHGALVVVQEWWGVTPWLKEQTDRLAEQGYVALAVDLYRGKVAQDTDEAHQLSRLPPDRAIADLEAGFEALSKRPDVDPKRIGVIGWCMGGGFAFDLATHEPKLKAVVVNYGHLTEDKESIKKLKADILGNFGAKDKGIPKESVEAFEKEAKAAKKNVDMKVYDKDGHAFMNPGNKEGYDAESTADAWKRIDGFLAKELKGG